MKFIKRMGIGLIICSGLVSAGYAATQPTQKDHANDDKNIVVLNAAAQKTAGIKVIPLQPQQLTASVTAPGEVIPNANLTTKATTRVTAQVVQLKVQEGQHVKKNDVLAILSSVDMAKIQGDLLLASQDWERVKSLGKDAISGKRYSEAQVSYQHAYSTAMAYGMTESEINNLLRSQKPSQAQGEFNLLAMRDGTLFNIHFTEGELVEPGRVLMQIVDESTVWIDAKLPPNLVQPVKIGDPVNLTASGKNLTGRVIQVHHQLDEVTRTQSVRIEAPNTADLLHPGQFVNCQIEVGQAKPVLALPSGAVVRTDDGDSAVFVENQPGNFQRVEVKVTNTINGLVEIEGLNPGTHVVVEGVFFVKSELDKKGFDAHGH